MKVAIFDCFSGASGDMIIASMLDLALEESDLEDVRRVLKLDLDFKIKEVSKKGIKAKRVEVMEMRKKRSYEEVVKLIEESRLNGGLKNHVLKIFERLAIAESKVHGKDYKKAVFHEVGSDDAIFDIVCSAKGILELKKNGYRVYTTPVNAGRGFVESEHGMYPVPAPATLEIVRMSNLKISIEGEGELLTPTGAAILAHFSEGEPNFSFYVERISYGAGYKEWEVPNLLRLILGKSFEKDEVVVIETTVDDMTGEDLRYAMDVIMKESHDVYAIPGIGKKGRPCFEIKAVCDAERAERVAELILRQTSTLGVRILPFYHRIKVSREVKNMRLKIGEKEYSVRVKVSDYGFKPEFEDIKRISEESGLSIEEVRRAVELKIYEASKRK